MTSGALWDFERRKQWGAVPSAAGFIRDFYRLEDEQVSDLYPISISRAAYTITGGGYRLIDLLAGLDRPVRWLVRPHLREIQDGFDFNLLLES